MQHQHHQQSLFETVLIVSLDSYSHSIKFCYPPNQYNSELVKQAPQFCFPEQKSFRTSILLLNFRETFSFILTLGNGSKVFGYCRRYLHEGIATCICILTLLPSFGLYSGMLNILESFANSDNFHNNLSSFLYLVSNSKTPAPGKHVSIHFSFPHPRTDSLAFKLFRPSGCNLLEDFVEFTNLLQCLNIKLIIQLWECLLKEERIILCSKYLGKLTSSINAAIAILNPLSWQHILIPVLPNSMIDYCTAPMPFLIGVLPDALPNILQLPLEKVYIFNLDEQKCSINNEISIIPKLLRNNLISSLETITKTTVSASNTKARDINIARCFLVCLATLLEGYEKYIKDNSFQQNEFNNSNSLYKQFKETLAQTQIWECFIETQIELENSPTKKTCILHTIGEWNSNNLDFPCFKCNTTIFNGEVFIYKGFPLCKQCYKRKKNQITRDNVKNKFTKVKRRRHGKQFNTRHKRRASVEITSVDISIETIKTKVNELKERNEEKRRIVPTRGLSAPTPPPVPERKLISSSVTTSKQLPPPPMRERSATVDNTINYKPLSAPKFKQSQKPPVPKIPTRGNRIQRGRNINGVKSPRGNEIRCGGCREIINKKNPNTLTIQAVRRQWHPKCFKCFHCKEYFSITFEDMIVNNMRPYHKKCLLKKNIKTI